MTPEEKAAKFGRTPPAMWTPEAVRADLTAMLERLVERGEVKYNSQFWKGFDVAIGRLEDIAGGLVSLPEGAVPHPGQERADRLQVAVMRALDMLPVVPMPGAVAGPVYEADPVDSAQAILAVALNAQPRPYSRLREVVRKSVQS